MTNYLVARDSETRVCYVRSVTEQMGLHLRSTNVYGDEMWRGGSDVMVFTWKILEWQVFKNCDAVMASIICVVKVRWNLLHHSSE